MRRERGFNLPIVYNTSGYESVEALRLLDGIVDIYLPDMRYSDEVPPAQVLDCTRTILKSTVRRSRKCTGRSATWLLDENGIAKRGLIIRHLVLPERLSGTESIMKFLAEEISKDVYISLMSQYFPAYKATDMKELSRRITAEEYEEACRIMEKYGLENGWVQELE